MIRDRATVVATAILQIATDVSSGPHEMQRRLTDYLRDEFTDIARQLAGEKEEEESEMSDTYEMGPASDAPDLRGMTFDDAVDAVVAWFDTNFEDPAESTPYETAEGGYQYIWGGPCDAREEIDDAFSSIDEK